MGFGKEITERFLTDQGRAGRVFRQASCCVRVSDSLGDELLREESSLLKYKRLCAPPGCHVLVVRCVTSNWHAPTPDGFCGLTSRLPLYEAIRHC